MKTRLVHIRGSVNLGFLSTLKQALQLVRRALVVTADTRLVRHLTVEEMQAILTTARLDCLAHQATVLTTKGKAYRVRKRRGQSEDASRDPA